ncbi:hypothetical protein [Proteiniborus sp. MB09-C3]|uniref:hypothetical protein n=1 Tax=Proteiniborus sp. MB09-C3 TaxID=3050072 RepID=UPI002556672B|nr:hypothetical protein [Proteiniborus sp. MB09-C3]WIV10638.1 hypothetical protein QO263_10760 [Proteiniborus sp. MB09-C3]
MLDPYLKNLEVFDVYCQNDYQEIYACKHKEKNAYYLLNLIKDKELFDGVDFKEFRKCISSIVEIEETDEAILIITEHYSYKSLLEYVEKDDMTLTKQINNVTYIMETLLRLKDLPYGFFVSLFNCNNILIDNNREIKLSGILLLNPEIMNASIEEALMTIANAIHLFFARKEIIDRNISKGIPPDIEKMINKCLSGDYLGIMDLVLDFRSTSIYNLINPEKEDVKRVTRMRKSMSRKRITYNVRTKGILVALLLIPIIVWGSYSLLKHDKIDKDTIIKNTPVDIQDNIDADEESNDEATNFDEDIGQVEDSYLDDIFNYKEELDKFFNEDKIKQLNEDRIGIIDSSKFHRGEFSIKAHNDKTEKSSYLVGYIDFGDDNFSYVKNRTVNLSLWLNSDVGTDCSIILKLGSDDKILTQVVKKASVKENTWILHNIEVNTKNGKYIEIYIDIKPNDIIWVDTMDIDVLK